MAEEGVKPDPSDEMFCWDFWEFNGGIDKPMTVYMKSPHNEYDSEFAYEGPLRDDFIQEFEEAEPKPSVNLIYAGAAKSKKPYTAFLPSPATQL